MPDPEDGFRAHVSIGYVSRPGPAAPILDALAHLNLQAAQVAVRSASLVRLHQDARVYQWDRMDRMDRIEEVPLGDASRAEN